MKQLRSTQESRWWRWIPGWIHESSNLQETEGTSEEGKQREKEGQINQGKVG